MPLVNVPYVALDSYFDPATDIILIMKMDVEGSEINAFQGCKAMLEAKRVRNIMVELNKSMWKAGGTKHEDVLEMIEWLYGIGYNFYPSNYGGLFYQKPFPMEDWKSMLEEGWVSIDVWLTLETPEETAAVGTATRMSKHLQAAEAENKENIEFKNWG